jgi:hypothetical protein
MRITAKAHKKYSISEKMYCLFLSTDSIMANSFPMYRSLQVRILEQGRELGTISTSVGIFSRNLRDITIRGRRHVGTRSMGMHLRR